MKDTLLFEKIIEEATVDCHDEEEQLSGWACMLEDNIPTPCKCFIGKKEARLDKIEQGENDILGLVKIDKLKIRTPIEDVKLEDEKMRIYINAYKHWRKHG